MIPLARRFGGLALALVAACSGADRMAPRASEGTPVVDRFVVAGPSGDMAPGPRRSVSASPEGTPTGIVRPVRLSRIVEDTVRDSTGVLWRWIARPNGQAIIGSVEVYRERHLVMRTVYRWTGLTLDRQDDQVFSPEGRLLVTRERIGARPGSPSYRVEGPALPAWARRTGTHLACATEVLLLPAPLGAQSRTDPDAPPKSIVPRNHRGCFWDGVRFTTSTMGLAAGTVAYAAAVPVTVTVPPAWIVHVGYVALWMNWTADLAALLGCIEDAK